MYCILSYKYENTRNQDHVLLLITFLFYFSSITFTWLCLPTVALHVMGADPPIDKITPCLDEVREAVARQTDGKAASISNIYTELLKAGAACGLGCLVV